MAACGSDPALAGKSLADVTRERGRAVNFENAAETLLEIQHAGGCRAVYHAISEEDVERILRYPLTMIGSDGEVTHFGVDARVRSYGSFARVLGRYVRDAKTLTLEDAVHRMSDMTAGRLKLFDRGLLRPGIEADIVISNWLACASFTFRWLPIDSRKDSCMSSSTARWCWRTGLSSRTPRTGIVRSGSGQTCHAEAMMDRLAGRRLQIVVNSGPACRRRRPQHCAWSVSSMNR